MSVTPIGNSPINGRIVSWDFPGDLFIAIDGGKDSHFNATDVDNVQPLAACTAAIPRGPKTASAPVAPADWIVRLADSSQVLGNISGGDDERLLLHNADFGEIELPIERIDRLWRRAGREPPPAGDEDVVEMVNGDRLRGVMAGAEKGILRLSEGGDERPLAWEKIQTVALAAAKRGEPAGLSADIRLCDGSRFMSPKFNWKVGELHASFASMENLVIPDKLLIAIEVNGGRRKWLSDLPVEKYEAAPYFETQWGYRIDQNVLGGPLVLAGRTYRCGVGLHSACRITWNLGGAYQRLTALVGIDDSAGPHADADVIIRLDDREVLVLHGLRFGEAPRTIDLPVTGGDRLTIEVGFGKRGDVQDRVNVANAALIRK
ncbi:MAG TPA: NPCBM/NEW2 domain-containing protein [Phycisphaerae bacterium]|nr:NPCBM/NEW2 domain-containing protein [Phycisphaerae bacterium]